MKRSYRTALLSLSALAAIAALLWMRSLASWRPQKVGTFSKGYWPTYVSRDGRFVTAQTAINLRGGTPLRYESFDLKTGHQSQWSSEESVGGNSECYSGWSSGFYYTFGRVKNDNFSLGLKDLSLATKQHTLTWGSQQRDQSLSIARVGHNLCVLSRHNFKEFDLATDKLKRSISLKQPLPHSNYSPLFAISPDGRTLYGCSESNGAVWDSATGKRLKQWKMTGASSRKHYSAFSPDGRVVAYFTSSTFPSRYHFVDSTTGRRLWTETVGEPVGDLFVPEDAEIVLRRSNGCEVRDLLSGHLKRRLAGPRLSDGLLLRATHDWIYTCTANAKPEVFRWRAR